MPSPGSSGSPGTTTGVGNARSPPRAAIRRKPCHSRSVSSRSGKTDRRPCQPSRMRKPPTWATCLSSALRGCTSNGSWPTIPGKRWPASNGCSRTSFSSLVPMLRSVPSGCTRSASTKKTAAAPLLLLLPNLLHIQSSSRRVMCAHQIGPHWPQVGRTD